MDYVNRERTMLRGHAGICMEKHKFPSKTQYTRSDRLLPIDVAMDRPGKPDCVQSIGGLAPRHRRVGATADSVGAAGVDAAQVAQEKNLAVNLALRIKSRVSKKL